MQRWSLRGVSLSAALMCVAVACAKGEDGIDVGDGGIVPVEGGDARLTAPDGGGGGKDGSTPSDDSGGGGGCTGKVLINELQADGTNGAEFVELYNPNTCAVPLGGWKILYRASSGNTGPGLHTFGTGDSIAAKDFLLLGNNNFGAAPVKFNGGGGMGNSGGQLGLVDDADKLVDAVGYGAASGAYVEGSPAALPTGNGSVGRKSDGEDTDNNAADFAKFTTHSAGVAN